MTLLHATIDQQKGVIEVLADSRLSQAQGALTDAGPKVFAVPIDVATALPGAVSSKATYGFAFAGSFLIALATHTFASNVAANLLGTSSTFPSVADIADLYASTAQLYLEDVASAEFGFWIFGYCKREKSLRIFAVRPVERAGRWRVESSELSSEHRKIHLMGSGEVAFRRYRSMFVTLPELQLFENFIASGRDPRVGGAVQVALATRQGVEIPMYAHVHGNPEQGVKTYFNGRDTGEIMKVGECGIGRTAWGRDPRYGLMSGRR